ncbi:family 1 glycosylhydrolase [Streptomyces scopuliridis]|uniref:family 1 glycosylhydrolase n=1 Tax=Streptomyces scopuliridis TaxID=452529 RepID=UPI00344593D0
MTENGIATEDDAERIDYLESHLNAVLSAIGDGTDVRGYLHWSAFDNFEWAEGYRPKFGLIAVDRAAGFRREPKPSAYAFQRVAESGDLSQLRAVEVPVP